jgi:ribosome maturation factor RimP
VKRQYIKNLNRILKVKTAEEELEGTLISADEDTIVLQWKAREPKLVGKGKVTVDKVVTLGYNEIKEAKVKILF